MTVQINPPSKAYVIGSDREALEIARQLSQEFACESAVRDRERRLPYNELDRFSQSGSLGATVPMTLEEFNYSRYWRNAHTHTLHDPVRWKYHGVGSYYLNGIKSPRHRAF